jgi:transformation/transcription domain-associated protein
VALFINSYETPPKIIVQIFVSLLRAYQPETRTLVRTALDVLVPALRTRLRQDAAGPNWVRWTKKVLSEEAQQMPLLVHVLRLLARQVCLFVCVFDRSCN